MSDIVFVGVILAFFAFAVLFIRICEHLIGSDEDAVGQADTELPAKQAA
jgi:hypothetical protein